MSEYQERLWPERQAQPALEISIGGEDYSLRWQNTWVQTYRTGDETYDEGLRRYDHVLHKYAEDGEKADYVIFTLEQIGAEGLEFLHDKGYPRHVEPIPDHYILTYMASQEANTIPEALGPEFGAAA